MVGEIKMNKIQWKVLGIASWLLMVLFIFLDLSHGFILINDVCLGSDDIYCVVRGEVFMPFIYIFFVLGIVFHICSLFERKIYGK